MTKTEGNKNTEVTSRSRFHCRKQPKIDDKQDQQDIEKYCEQEIPK